jgi:adenine-specific DNA-methyltransferase
MARKKKDPTPEFPDLDATRHKDTRKNIPTEELRDFVAADEAAPPKMLYPRDPSLDPQLIWNGKDEQDREPLEVDVVPIYIQEVIEPRVIIDAIESRRTTKPDNGGFLPGFFDDFEALEFDRKVEFYQHDQHWANRMILGNSLHVMTSLAEKEGLKGKVQMIYIDPPYGIKYGSNWQVSTRKRDVKDGKLEDTSRQPEQIRAFRDTWRIGIHSYLAYLRDRLVVARELLTDAGSIFVQIGDENVHLVRSILDETFGSENIISLISFSKTASTTGRYLPNTSDYVIWYAKDAERMKYRPLYLDKAIGGGGAGKYDQVQLTDNTRRPFLSGERQDPTGLPIGARPFRLDNLTSPRIREARTGYYPVSIKGRSFLPQQGEWKTHSEGMSRLIVAGRVQITGNSLSYVRFLDDFPAFGLSNTWIDIGGIVSNMEPGYRANGRPPSMISQAGLASPKSAQIYPLKPSASGFRERYT